MRKIFLIILINCGSVLIVNGIEDFATNQVDIFKLPSSSIDHLEIGEQYNCGGSSRSSQTVIQSPNYPNNYDSNLNCKYIIRTSELCDNEFELRFEDFKIEASANCANDRAIINDQDLLCGSVIGIKKYQATNGALSFKFKSNGLIENKGFRILVTRLPCTDEVVESETDAVVTPINLAAETTSELVEEESTIVDEIITTPSLDLLPPVLNSRQFTIENVGKPVNQYLPPSNQYLPPSNQYLPPSNQYLPSYPDQNYPSTPGLCHPNGWYPARPSNPAPPTWGQPTVPPSWNQPPNWNNYPPTNPPTWNGPVYPPSWNNQPPASPVPPIWTNPTIPPSWNQPPASPVPPIWTNPTNPPPWNQPPASPVPPIWTNPTSPPLWNQPPTANPPGSNSIPPYNPDNPQAYPVPPIYTYPNPTGPEKQVGLVGQCCTTPFNQRRFYLVSPGFPSTTTQNRECAFTITKNNPNVCQLRINFKFLVMNDGSEAPNLGCINHFIQIDGLRTCGCQTGMSYLSDWRPGTLGSKVIYYKSTGGYSRNVRGFVIEIIQEECQGQQARSGFQDRSGDQIGQEQVLVPHTAVVQTNSSSLATYYYYDPENTNHSVEEDEFGTIELSTDGRRVQTPSRFFFSGNGNGLGGDRCTFGYLQWLRLSAEALWVSKPVCYPPRINNYYQ